MSPIDREPVVNGPEEEHTTGNQTDNLTLTCDVNFATNYSWRKEGEDKIFSTGKLLCSWWCFDFFVCSYLFRIGVYKTTGDFIYLCLKYLYNLSTRQSYLNCIYQYIYTY